MLMSHKEQALLAIVDMYGPHEALKGLVEVCYRKAHERAQSEPSIAQNWRLLAVELTRAEGFSSSRKF